MFICGNSFCGGEFACALTPTAVKNINYIELKNGVYDDLYMTKATGFALSHKITEGWTFDTILWAKFNGNTNAGNVDWSTGEVSHLLLKRRLADKFQWNTLAVKEISSIEDFAIYYNDYTNASGATYEYAIVPSLYGLKAYILLIRPTLISKTCSLLKTVSFTVRILQTASAIRQETSRPPP